MVQVFALTLCRIRRVSASTLRHRRMRSLPALTCVSDLALASESRCANVSSVRALTRSCKRTRILATLRFFIFLFLVHAFHCTQASPSVPARQRATKNISLLTTRLFVLLFLCHPIRNRACTRLVRRTSNLRHLRSSCLFCRRQCCHNSKSFRNNFPLLCCATCGRYRLRLLRDLSCHNRIWCPPRTQAKNEEAYVRLINARRKILAPLSRILLSASVVCHFCIHCMANEVLNWLDKERMVEFRLSTWTSCANWRASAVICIQPLIERTKASLVSMRRNFVRI